MLHNAFKIEYNPKPAEMQTQLLEFSVVDFKDSQEILIQLNFSEPLVVSYNADSNSPLSRDQIFVSLKDAEVFLDPRFNKPLSPTLLQNALLLVPKQEPQQSSTFFTTTAAVASTVATAALPGALLINILLGLSLKKLWSTINLL